MFLSTFKSFPHLIDVEIHLSTIKLYLSPKRKLSFCVVNVSGGQTVSVTDENASETTDANILQTRSNSAYVTHQLRAQKINLEKCPAYERVGRRAVTT